MRSRLLILAVLTTAAVCPAQSQTCAPASQVQAELQQAAASPVTDASDFERNIAPFRALRERHPENLFVNQAYQDAVQRLGIEGHLRALTEEYQGLFNQHPDDLKYRYLYTRTLIGRGTAGAIQGLNEIVQANPDFAPAHGELAEIYALDIFRDDAKEASEREKFLALCPGAASAKMPPDLQPPSPLLDQAEQLMTRNGDATQAIALALQGIRADEWRLQRVRPFDWYSVDYKRQLTTELQGNYWRLWSIQVRGYRKNGDAQKADATLAMMEQRAGHMRRDSELVQWQALAALVRLYAEGNEKNRAAQKLDALRHLMALNSDASRASQFEDLRRLVEAGK